MWEILSGLILCWSAENNGGFHDYFVCYSALIHCCNTWSCFCEKGLRTSLHLQCVFCEFYTLFSLFVIFIPLLFVLLAGLKSKSYNSLICLAFIWVVSNYMYIEYILCLITLRFGLYRLTKMNYVLFFNLWVHLELFN